MTIYRRINYSKAVATIYNRISCSKLYLNLAVMGAYLLLTIIATWPILPNFDKQVTDIGDPFFISWVVGSETWSLRTGDFANFWNQNIFYPYNNTLAYSDHSLTLTLQALPTYLVTGNPIVTINTLQLESFFLSALFAFYLVSYYTGSRKAGFFGGVAYAFSSYHVAQISHIQIISYQYIPLTLLFFEKLLKTPNLKNAVFFALAFTLNAFVSIYLMGFIIVPLGIIFILRLISHEVSLNQKFLVNFALAGILTALLVVPWLLPYPEVSQAFNIERTPAEYYSYSAHFGDFVVANNTNWLMSGFRDSIIESDPRAAWNERTVYLGFLTVAVALFGAATFDRKKNRLILSPTGTIWFTILLACLALSIGPIFSYTVSDGNYSIIYGPYYLLYQFSPIFKGIRVPSRIIVIVVLALAVLIGFAVQKAATLTLRKRLLAFAAIGLILLIEQGSFPLKLVTPTPLNTSLYDWTAANVQKDAVVVHYPFSNDLNIEYERGSLIDHKRTLNGYSSFMPESIARLQDLSQTDPDSFLKVAATLGVKYLVIHANHLTANDNFPAYVETHATLIKAIGGGNIYDISAFKNPDFYTTPTVLSVTEMQKGRLLVQQGNKSSSIWVSPKVEDFNIQLNFIKENKKVGETKFSLYKPLYLLPGETFSNTMVTPQPLFTSYDTLTADVK